MLPRARQTQSSQYNITTPLTRSIFSLQHFDKALIHKTATFYKQMHFKITARQMHIRLTEYVECRLRFDLIYDI